MWDSMDSHTKVDLNDVHFGNDIRGHIVGDAGTIMNTTDGGYTWQTQTSPVSNNLRSVCMFDPFHGFICGENGVILTTQNGGILDKAVPLPQTQNTIHNYPNPFSFKTIFEVPMVKHGSLRIKIYNLLGEEIASLADGVFDSGLKTFEWDASNAASGKYLCKVDTDGEITTLQITVEK